MNRLLLTVLLMFAATVVHASQSSVQDELFPDNLTPDERTALVERLKQAPFDEIAPALLKTRAGYRPMFWTNPWTDTPWNEDRMDRQARRFYMACAVWRHHMSPKDDPVKARLLLDMLKEASGPDEKRLLISAVRNDQWCPDAEEMLLSLSKNEEEDLGIRSDSAVALTHRCDVNAYMPLVMEFVLAQDAGIPRLNAFSNMVTGNLFDLNEKNRRSVLAAGFEMLAALPDGELQHGYFVASRMGRILKASNDFKPDHKDPTYQEKHGLKDEFFIDTVLNARAWYENNKHEFEPDDHAANHAPDEEKREPVTNAGEGASAPPKIRDSHHSFVIDW